MMSEQIVCDCATQRDQDQAAVPAADVSRGEEARPRYVPCDYVDEWSPPHRTSPSDWIIRSGLGWHLVECPDYTQDEGDQPGAALSGGQIVKFPAMVKHPDRMVTMRRSEDGDLTYDHVGFIPTDANMFWLDGDTETQTDTLKYCFECYDDMEPFADGQEIELSAATWTEADFRFVVDGDSARFELAPHQEPRS